MADSIELIKGSAMQDPLQIQQAVVGEFQDRLGGDSVMVDPNNTFSFLTEMMSRLTADTVNEMTEEMNSLYPARAQTHTDLFKHMSDFDYIGLYATPASTDMVLFFDKNFLVENAAWDESDDLTIPRKRVYIPQDSYFTMGELTFRMYYPVWIDISLGQNQNPASATFSVYWDTSSENSLYTLTTQSLEHRVQTYEDLEVLSVRIPVHQFTKQTFTESITEDTGFINVYDYEDKFYAVKVWHNPDESTTPDVQMAQTLSGRVYSVNEPTAYISVKPEFQKCRIAVPQVYFSTRRMGTNLKIELFTTKGALDTEISRAEASNVQAVIPAGNEYTEVLHEIPLFTAAAASNRIVGGSDGSTFEELKDRVISSSFYSRVPVTTGELESYFKDAGFHAERYRDGITDRVYRCYRTLTDSDGRAMLAGGLRTRLRPDYVIGQGYNSVTTNPDGSYTFLPNNVYSVNRDTGHLEFHDIVDNMMSSDNIKERLNNFTGASYVFSPLHLKLWTSDRYPVAQSYMLSDPSVRRVEFVKANMTQPGRVSVFNADVAASCTGFDSGVTGSDSKGRYTVRITTYYQGLGDENNEFDISADAGVLAVMQTLYGRYVGRIFSFNDDGSCDIELDTDFELLQDEGIGITNFTNPDISSSYVSLKPILSLYFLQDLDQSGSSEDLKNNLESSIYSLLTHLISVQSDVDTSSGFRFLNHQQITLDLGRRISEVDNPVEIGFEDTAGGLNGSEIADESKLNEVLYSRYAAPVFERDEYGVIQYTDNELSDWSFPSDTPQYELTFTNTDGDEATVAAYNGSDPADVETGMAVDNSDNSIESLTYIIGVQTADDGTVSVKLNQTQSSYSTDNTVSDVAIGEPSTPLLSIQFKHRQGDWLFDESVIHTDSLSVDSSGNVTLNDDQAQTSVSSRMILDWLFADGVSTYTLTKINSTDDNVFEVSEGVSGISTGMAVESIGPIPELTEVTAVDSDNNLITVSTSLPDIPDGIAIEDDDGNSDVRIASTDNADEAYWAKEGVSVCIISHEGITDSAGQPKQDLYIRIMELDGSLHLRSIYDSSTEVLSSSSADTYSADMGVPQIKGKVGDPDIYQPGYIQTTDHDDIIYTDRQLTYLLPMIHLSADYIISGQTEYRDILNTVSRTLNAYFESVENIRPNLLEVTNLFFLPIQTMGNTELRNAVGTTWFGAVEFGVRYRLYVTEATLNSSEEKQTIRDEILSIINEETMSGVFSTARAAGRIQDQLADRVKNVDVIGVKDEDGGYDGPATIIPESETADPVLDNTLYVDDTGTPVIGKDLELEFVPAAT